MKERSTYAPTPTILLAAADIGLCMCTFCVLLYLRFFFSFQFLFEAVKLDMSTKAGGALRNMTFVVNVYSTGFQIKSVRERERERDREREGGVSMYESES